MSTAHLILIREAVSTNALTESQENKGYLSGKLGVKLVLVVAHRQIIKLRGGAENGKHVLDARFGRQARVEEVRSKVVQVVIRGDAAHRGRVQHTCVVMLHTVGHLKVFNDLDKMNKHKNGKSGGKS